MPLYDMKCSKCDHVEEVLVRNGAFPSICTKCGSNDCMAQLLSTGTQFYFKDGNGAYDRGSLKHKLPGVD